MLFSIYPVIFLYTHNVEILHLNQLLFPLFIAFFLAITSFLLWKIVFKDGLKASFAATGFLILFWNYDLFYQGINYVLNLKHWHTVPLFLFIYGHLVFFLDLINKKIDLEKVNQVLFLTLSILIVYNLVMLMPAEIQKRSNSLNKCEIQDVIRDKDKTDNYPDIYLIILDEYASINTIKKEWGYNNDGFVNFLRDKGFFVAEKSEHRYFQTMLSMSTLLNLEYITGPVEKNDLLDYFYNPDKIKGKQIYEELKSISDSYKIRKWSENYLVSFLKEKGYKIIILEGISQHYPTFNINNADFSIAYQDIIDESSDAGKSFFYRDAFYMELFKRTILSFFDIYLQGLTGDVNYDGTKYVFNYLKKDIYYIKSPKFVYAHILCPHIPFVFDRDGNYVVSTIDKDNNAYLEQYIYVTKEMRDTINKILTQSSDPIIIVQNDHGPRPHLVNLKDENNAFQAFNAVYFPSQDYQKLHDSIAPVNTLRVMLNQYFNENFEMLEER